MENTNINKQINTTPSPKKKNIYKYLFYITISVLIYTIVVYATNYQALLKSYNDKLVSSEKNTDTSNTCPEPEHLFDGFDYNYSDKFYPNNLVFRVNNIGFLFPKSSYSIFSGRHVISINDKFYEIAFDQTHGLCPESDEDEGQNVNSPSCTYEDEKINMEAMDGLRLWKENNKIFGINPSAIGWGTNSVSGMVIAKQSPNLLSKETLYFTNEEVKMWKEILSNPVKFPYSAEN